MKNRRLLLPAVTCLVLMPLVGLQSAGAQEEAPPAPDEGPSFYMVSTSGSSDQGADFSDLVEDSAEAVPSDVAETRAALRQMAEQASAGDPVDLSTWGGGSAPADVQADLDEALDRIEDGSPSDEPQVAPVQALDVPSNYEIRGGPFLQRDKRTYTLQVIFRAGPCGPIVGCDETTDEINQTYGFDPGRIGSRVSVNSRYFPRTGDGLFNDIFSTTNIYANGEEAAIEKRLGAGGARDGNGFAKTTLRHDSHAGKKIVMLVRAQADFTPEARTLYDRARTTQARCFQGERRYCRFNLNRTGSN